MLPTPVTVSESFDKDVEAVTLDGDVLERLKEIPDETFHLVATSPPYNIGKSYEEKQSLDSYIDWMKDVIKEIHRVTKHDGSVVWQTGNFIDKGEVYPLDIYFYPLFKELDFRLRNRIIWRFGHGLHCKNRFSGRYETLLWFTKSDEYTFNLDSVRIPSKEPSKRHFKGPNKGKLSGNPLGKNPSDFWDVILNQKEQAILDIIKKEWVGEGVINIPNVKSNHVEKTDHPCQFPIELVERCVLALTNKDGLVLDPFEGSGSTLIASIKQGRRCVLIDKEKSYLDIAKNRLEAFSEGRLRVREIGTPITKATGKTTQYPDEWKNNKEVKK